MPLPSLTDVLHWFGRYRPRYAASLGALAALLLFLPSSALRYFAVEGLARDHRGIVSLVFLGSLTLLTTYPIEQAWALGSRQIRRHRRRKRLEGVFHTLGDDQIRILSEYVQSGNNSLHFSLTNGAIQDLVAKGILYRPEQALRQYHGVWQAAYNVMPDALPFLRYEVFEKQVLKTKTE